MNASTYVSNSRTYSIQAPKNPNGNWPETGWQIFLSLKIVSVFVHMWHEWDHVPSPYPFVRLLLRFAPKRYWRWMCCFACFGKMNVTEVHKITYEIDKWAEHTCWAQTIVSEEAKSIGRKPTSSLGPIILASVEHYNPFFCMPDTHTWARLDCYEICLSNGRKRPTNQCTIVS